MFIKLTDVTKDVKIIIRTSDIEKVYGDSEIVRVYLNPEIQDDALYVRETIDEIYTLLQVGSSQ
jgi:hypothetical protein